MVSFLGIIILGIYFPVLLQKNKEISAVKAFYQELELLDETYKKCVIIIPERLGEGAGQNSDIRFAQAHRNQKLAIASIINLFDCGEI
jgi:hypothetical protein